MAWREVDTSTIRNCWRHARILPKETASDKIPAPSIPIASLLNVVEQDIAESLDLLEKKGVLSRRNCLSIKELLNPDHENEIIDVNISDEEISAAVREKHQALQKLEINGGDDDDDDAILENPSRREALAASLTLQRYIADIVTHLHVNLRSF